MIEKYYSEKTKKYYNTKKDCMAAELEYDKVHEAEIKEREAAKRDAEEIKVAYDEMVAARKHYIDLVNQFNQRHNGYRLTITSDDFFNNFFDNLFRW